jgi:peptide/nickel transport system substrate-binding protein
MVPGGTGAADRRAGEERMTRLRWTLAAAALLALPAAAQETPRRGGTLIYAVNSESPTYDCIGTTSFVAVQTVGVHYSRLLRYDPQNYPQVVPDAAESWTVSPDGLTYSFRLRENVRFHDGSVLMSEDVRASFERARKPPPGVVSVRPALLEDVAAIETPDARTVVFRLSAPNSSMPMNFAAPANCLYSAAKLREDPTWPIRNVMGTGPFRFKEHVKGSHWVGERFDGYFLPGRPYLDGFRVQFMSGAPMVNALQAGQIHAEFRSLTPAERDKLRQALGDGIRIEESPWVCKIDVFFNVTRPPFDDIRVRRALSLAIDRWRGADAMSRVTTLKGVGGVLRPGYEFAIAPDELAKLPGFGRDIEAARAEARRLLKEAGQENLKFALLNRDVPQPFQPAAIFVVDQWRQIGVQAEHQPRPLAQQKGNFSTASFDVGLDATCFDGDDPNVQLIMYLSKDKAPSNFSHSTDAKLDELYERQKRAATAAERARLLREFEVRALTESYSTPVIYWQRIVAHSPALRGWKITASHYVNQDLIDVWLAN